ncbi:MAG: 6-hydroxycyclohex-1-ene-1-carbonyl-CoA dehydrogenase [Candidatus Latescibacterota bacterium]|jgi:6-hydroxycyclohex-1-ene-1-carbonyl-CoA dehydrogenase
MERIDAYGYALVEPAKPLQKKEFTIDTVDDGDAVVRVAGCGLCHTDIGFYTGQVQTFVSPVILGHEISGEVVAAGGSFDNLVGKQVVVPAVLPCGECELCKKGRSNVCQAQRMPGNHMDGGFATHVVVPARYLCELPADLGGYDLSNLSVIADAVTTPYQSMMRSGLESGDLAVVIGVGGLGTYMVQLAKAKGASVIALDVDDNKLKNAAAMGADFTLNVRDVSEKDVKNSVRGLVKENKLPKTGWKVFEMSGTGAGQMTAFSLLSFAGAMGVVGFTMDKINIRLSNVMAFDADLFGNWGCKPEYYPEVVSEVLKGKINVRDNVETHPLDSINEIFPMALEHKIEKRVVFEP